MSLSYVPQAVLLQIERAPSGDGLLTFRDAAVGPLQIGVFEVLATKAQIDALVREQVLPGAPDRDAVMVQVTGAFGHFPHPMAPALKVFAMRLARFKKLAPPQLPEQEAALRQLVVEVVRFGRRLTGVQNPYDGVLTMGWVSPGVDSDDPSPLYRVQLTAKVIDPMWAHEWAGPSPEAVLFNAAEEIKCWMSIIAYKNTARAA